MVPGETEWRSLGAKLMQLELNEGEAAALQALIDGQDAEVSGFAMRPTADLLGFSKVVFAVTPEASFGGDRDFERLSPSSNT